MCLIARHFEARGLPTLILGSARDILEAGRPPRAVFLDYPLGFEAGKPYDPDNQHDILRQAVAAFDDMQAPEIRDMPFTWTQGWEMISRREAASAGKDFRSPRDETPRYQTEEDKKLARPDNFGF